MTEGDPTRDEPGQWIGRDVDGKYRIVGLLGRGGMGAVYEAENMALGKRVAIKVVNGDSVCLAENVRRFEREARAAGTIESSHVVQVFDVGKLEDGRPYMVMELLRGENLATRLGRLGTMAPSDAVHLASQVLSGLRRAHENAVIHRDLKPENIFVVETDADPAFAKILDFGISKIASSTRGSGTDTITRDGVVLGTAAYMAPEQAQTPDELDQRADLWSVGVILYECLTGQKPFAGNSYEQVIIAICTSTAPSLRGIKGIPESLANVVGKSLARSRDERFSSANEFLGALQAVAEQEQYGIGRTQDTGPRVRAGGSEMGRMSEVLRPGAWARQQRFVYWGLAFVAFAALLLVAAAFGFAHRQPSGQSSGQPSQGLLEDESSSAASSGVQLVTRVDAGLDVDSGLTGSPAEGSHSLDAGVLASVSASVSASASGIVSANPPVVRQPLVKPNPVPSPSRSGTDDVVTGLKIKEDL